MSRDRKAYKRAWRALNKEKGLCAICGVRPAQSNKVSCEECEGKQRARKAQRKEKGLCMDCGTRPAQSDKTYCEECASKQRAQYAQHKEKRLCTCCKTRPARSNKFKCEKCASNHRARYVERKEKGICLDCGTRPSRSNKTACEECASKRRYQRCAIDRWANSIAHGQKRRGIMLSAETVKNVWEKQQGRCAILDLSLTLGENASVDHIIPVSKGGASDESNVRIVHRALNTAKNNMDDEEFFSMCRLVASKYPLDPDPVPEVLHATSLDD